MSLAVLTYCWGNKYGPEYLANLVGMFRRRLSIQHRFLVITDDPALPIPAGAERLEGLDRGAPFWDWPECYRRLFLQSAEATAILADTGVDRVLQVDLDTLVLDDLDPLIKPMIDTPAAIWRAPSIGRYGYTLNPSLFLFRPGYLAPVYKAFAQRAMQMIEARKAAGWIGSDQGILSHALAGGGYPFRTWDEADGVYSMRDHIMGSDPRARRVVAGQAGCGPPAGARLVGFYGRWRIDRFASEPWVAEHWRP